jgi:hypothetical protein
MDAVIESPYNLIDQLFDHSFDTDSGLQKLSSNFGDEQFFKSHLENVEFMQRVPSFQIEALGRIQPNTLVKFRGLVQDVCDPEFYCGAFRSKDKRKFTTSKYRDTIHYDCDLSDECVEDCIYLERCVLDFFSTPCQF